MQVTARSASDILGIQVNTAALFYRKLRQIILDVLLSKKPVFSGEIELDESYFGGVHGEREDREPVVRSLYWDFLRVGGKVSVIGDTKSDALMPIIVKKIRPDSIVYTDCYGSYNAFGCSRVQALP